MGCQPVLTPVRISARLPAWKSIGGQVIQFRQELAAVFLCSATRATRPRMLVFSQVSSITRHVMTEMVAKC